MRAWPSASLSASASAPTWPRSRSAWSRPAAGPPGRRGAGAEERRSAGAQGAGRRAQKQHGHMLSTEQSQGPPPWGQETTVDAGSASQGPPVVASPHEGELQLLPDPSRCVSSTRTQPLRTGSRSPGLPHHSCRPAVRGTATAASASSRAGYCSSSPVDQRSVPPGRDFDVLLATSVGFRTPHHQQRGVRLPPLVCTAPPGRDALMVPLREVCAPSEGECLSPLPRGSGRGQLSRSCLSCR